LHIERTIFLALTGAIATGCGPAGAPASSPADHVDPAPATGGGPAAPAPNQHFAPGDTTAPEEGAVEGESACDPLVPSPCSEGAAPRDRCRSQARSLASESADSAASFLACVRSSSGALPPADATCAKARQACDQIAAECEQTREAARICRDGAAPTCMNVATLESTAACTGRCADSFKLDGCQGEQCGRVAQNLQACIAKCGNPGTEMDACVKAKCEAQDRTQTRCEERSSACSVPERCRSVDSQACQAGHALLDRCSQR
jgi:hypothetical protein